MATETKSQTTPQVSYKDKLVAKFKTAGQPSFKLADVINIINAFSEEEYQKRRADTGKFPFGKYKYKGVPEVVKFDRDYCTWVVQQEVMDKYPELKEILVSLLK